MGLDIVGLITPLVDLGFDLAGNVKTHVELTLGATFHYDAATESDLPTTGGMVVPVDAIRSKRIEDQGDTITAKDEHLLINVTDLEKAAAAAGQPVPQISTADWKAIIDGTKWDIVDVSPVTGGRLIDVRIRR